jgi:predicted DNA-binding transcriptional regulator YafY
MPLKQVEDAVKDRKVLAFDYDGKPRLVEPHAVGTNKKGDSVLRGFQVTGDSATNSTAWKLFTLEKIENLSVVALTSQAPRPGYKAGDKAMVTILAELPEPAPQPNAETQAAMIDARIGRVQRVNSVEDLLTELAA